MRDTGGGRFYFKRKPRTKNRVPWFLNRVPWFLNRGPRNGGPSSEIRAARTAGRVSLLTGQGLRNRG